MTLASRKFVKNSLVGLSLLRSLHYFVEYQSLRVLTHLLAKDTHHDKRRAAPMTREGLALLAKEIRQLFEIDVEAVANGQLPPQILWTESPLQHLKRFPKVALDGLRLSARRKNHQAHEFTDQAKPWLEELPEYYRRNFHFQTDGYLSEDSAELYDHQVELLFAGAADAMRRIVLPELVHELGDGQGQTFLEIACGTGSMTKNLRLAIPKARIVATDLSAPYLKLARRRLNGAHRVDFLEADASNLPFQDSQFDMVYSVFLFHELPTDIRKQVIREASRVLKPGGLFVYVDSIQLNDKPQFNDVLERFPVDFHEPFYKNYVDTPMGQMIEASGFQKVATRFGFLAKGEVFRKPR